MKQKWTKELWHVIVDNETSDAVVVMRDEDSKNYYELGRFNTSTFSKGLALRNALRTVACINAMRGIKDPEEMRKALKEFWSEETNPVHDPVLRARIREKLLFILDEAFLAKSRGAVRD